MTGIEGLISADGKLERPASQGVIAVPEVRLEAEWLVWELFSGRRRYRPSGGLLEDFMQRETATPEAIHRFARQRGVLGICERHGLPMTHKTTVPPGVRWPPESHSTYCMPARVPRTFRTTKERQAAPIELREHVSSWRAFAREAAGILRLANALHAGHHTADADWMAVYARDPFIHDAKRPIPWWPTNRRDRRGDNRSDKILASSKVNEWMVLGNIRPMLDWFRGGAARIIFTAADASGNPHTTLFGALALQVLLVVSSAKGLTICSSCQTPFVPSRRPRHGERSYCEDCRESAAPWRDAKRDQRARRP